MSIIETNFGIFCILTIVQWNIVIDDWQLDGNSLSKGQWLQQRNSIVPAFVLLQGMTNNVRFTYGVGDTTNTSGLPLVLSETKKIGDTKGLFTRKPLGHAFETPWILISWECHVPMLYVITRVVLNHNP